MILRIPIGAFLSSPESVAAMEALSHDRMLFHSRIETREGGMDAAASFLADKKTPDLLILESTQANREAFLAQLETVANVCDPNTRVILIGTLNDIELYRILTESGVSDYLLAPIDELKLKNSITKTFANNTHTGGGKVTAFLGVSGGTGSSVIAHNVAHLLSKEHEKRVTLIDLDMYFGTASLDLNFEPRHTLVDIVSQQSGLDAEVFSQLVSKTDDDLLVVASPGSLNIGLQLDYPAIEALVREAKALSDFVILDLPHTWGPLIDDTIALADDLVLVSRPDLSGLRNAKILVETLGPKRKVDATTRIILNQVGGNKQAEIADKDFTNALALTPDAAIPLDPESFGKALNDGKMLTDAFPKSGAAKAIADFAARMALTAGGIGKAKIDKKTPKGFSLSDLFKGGKKG